MNTVITSFTQDGYEKYGKEFLETMEKHFIKPVVYFEGDEFPEGNAEWKSIYEIGALNQWMRAIAPFPLMRGDVGDGKYNIQFDAGMVRKPYMQAHACLEYGGKVFWMDADAIVHADVPDTFLDECLPDDKFCCFLGRDRLADKHGQMYTESGFIGFNTDHELFEPFFAAYMDIFEHGYIFTQSRWHDCQGFDMVRRSNPKQLENFVDLAADFEPNMHPYVNSVLGKYFDHRKGPRKKSRSTKKDLVVERDEAYWDAV